MLMLQKNRPQRKNGLSHILLILVRGKTEEEECLKMKNLFLCIAKALERMAQKKLETKAAALKCQRIEAEQATKTHA